MSYLWTFPWQADATHYEWIDTWKDFYSYEPTEGVSGDLSLILGGEAAMWGEQVDDTCIDGRVWPRAAAVGERLWSAESVTDEDDATDRLIHFRCHLARRGISAGPIAPDYCPLSLEVPSLPENYLGNVKFPMASLFQQQK